MNDPGSPDDAAPDIGSTFLVGAAAAVTYAMVSIPEIPGGAVAAATTALVTAVAVSAICRPYDGIGVAKYAVRDAAPAVAAVAAMSSPASPTIVVVAVFVVLSMLGVGALSVIVVELLGAFDRGGGRDA